VWAFVAASCSVFLALLSSEGSHFREDALIDEASWAIGMTIVAAVAFVSLRRGRHDREGEKTLAFIALALCVFSIGCVIFDLARVLLG
jgi:hypothetical protein